MTDEEIIAQLKNLPKIPAVLAKDMMYAQGWKPTDAERESFQARADLFEKLGMSREVNIPVLDVYTKGRIGTIVYNA